MEVLSNKAHCLIKTFIKIRKSNKRGRIYYKENKELIDNNDIFIQELCDKGLCVKDVSGDVGLTEKGLYYLPEHKAFMDRTLLTSLWLPFIVSILGTSFTLFLNYLIKLVIGLINCKGKPNNLWRSSLIIRKTPTPTIEPNIEPTIAKKVQLIINPV